MEDNNRARLRRARNRAQERRAWQIALLKRLNRALTEENAVLEQQVSAQQHLEATFTELKKTNEKLNANFGEQIVDLKQMTKNIQGFQQQLQQENVALRKEIEALKKENAALRR